MQNGARSGAICFFYPTRLYLPDCHYFCHAGDLLLERPLNTLLEGNGGHPSAAAGSLEAHLDQAIIVHVYQFHIPAVPLQHRPELFERSFDLFPHGANLLSFTDALLAIFYINRASSSKTVSYPVIYLAPLT
jgi:hypothetical protein